MKEDGGSIAVGNTSIEVGADKLRIATGFEIEEHDVVAFFSELDPRLLDETFRRSVSLGVTGLRTVGLASQADAVERQLRRLRDEFETVMVQAETRILEKVEMTFDPDAAGSVTADLGANVAATYKAAAQIIDSAKSSLEQLVEDSFNPDLTTSCVYRITKLVADVKSDLERTFDPAYENSYLARLEESIDSYFAEGGSLSDTIAAQVTPIKNDVLEALRDLRDVVVGQAAAMEARRLSAASGMDFENEVDECLRGIARTYGDSVERVGTQGGDAGSRKGDFVVQLKEGPRFVIEAKDYSHALPLRGSNGILRMLAESMLNRAAGFAICVCKDAAGFPKEVGVFNDYDGNKILSIFGQEGQLLETAYRWARMALLKSSFDTDALDSVLISKSIKEARDALRELTRIEVKATAIIKGAEDIKTLSAGHLAKVSAALDRAASAVKERERGATIVERAS